MEHGYGPQGKKASFKSMPRDGKQSAGIISGTSHKEKISEGEMALGMGYVGKNEKPAPNPSVSVSRGHTIK